MRFKIKKFISFLIILSVVTGCMTACSLLGNNNKYALDISGVEIDSDIYMYYMDKVHSSPEAYGLKEKASFNDCKQTVKQLCAEYIAINTLFKDSGKNLNYIDATDTSERVGDIWRLYSDYYENLGVSKSTITKIEESVTKKEFLFNYYYGTGGENEVPQKDVKDYFLKNYAAFLSINGYYTLTDDNDKTRTLTGTEKANLKTKFNNLAERIKSGETISEVAETYTDEFGSSASADEVVIISKDSTAYPEGFFDKIMSLEFDTPVVFEFENYLFLAIRENMGEDDDAYFNEYKTASLKALKYDEFLERIDLLTGTLKITENEKIINKLLESK